MNYQELFTKSMDAINKILGLTPNPELSEMEQLAIIESMSPLEKSIEQQSSEMAELKSTISKLEESLNQTKTGIVSEEKINELVSSQIKASLDGIKKEVSNEFAQLSTTIQTNLKGLVTTSVAEDTTPPPPPPSIKSITKKTPFGNVEFKATPKP